MSNTKHCESSLELLQAIKRRLKAKGWTQNSHNFQEFVFVELDNVEFQDSIVKCVQRAFKPLGWFLELDNYRVIESPVRNRYCYTWMLKKNFEKNL